MKKIAGLLLVVLIVWGIYTLILGGDDVNVITTNGEVLVATDSMDVRLARVRPFEGTLMLFGGGNIAHGDAISKVAISGLKIEDARRIYKTYPNFYMCKSRGATLAKRLLTDLNLVSSDSRILRTSKKAVDDLFENLRKDGDRVCVELKGERLRLESARIRDHDVDVTDKFVTLDYHLITYMQRIDCKAALEGG